jgi:hypothetical protein
MWLDGSTATIPTLSPASLYRFASCVINVLFPHPGGPVMPTILALRVTQYKLERMVILERASFSAADIS